MENKKYIVNRDDIHIGEVARTDSICRYNENLAFLEENAGQWAISCWTSYRSMLFIPTEENMSNDLLYRTPNYPILNMTSNETVEKMKIENPGGLVIIKDACNLSELLKYFGYRKDLTYEDVMRIRKTFFTGRFAKDHCELFGFREIMAEDLTFYVDYCEKVTDPKEIERRRKQFRADQKVGHRMFVGGGEGRLSGEYWRILDNGGDNSLIDAIRWHEKMNAFTPDRREGPVKRLKRY